MRVLQIARDNTGVIGLKLGRSDVRGKAQREGIWLRPANRAPYNRRRSPRRR